jgi:hypothetical protein
MRRFHEEPFGMDLLFVMAGLVPAIHVFLITPLKTWMPGTRPGMTAERPMRNALGSAVQA